MIVGIVEWLIDQYGTVSPNFAGTVCKWFDIAIWSAAEDAFQTFVGF